MLRISESLTVVINGHPERSEGSGLDKLRSFAALRMTVIDSPILSLDKNRRQTLEKIFFYLLCFAICTTVVSPLYAATPSKLIATSHGAAAEVSGSLHVLDTGNARWMIDCGTVFDEDRPGRLPKADRTNTKNIPQTLPPGVESVDAVFITHAHTDHLGRLPLLVQRGFAGPIYMTEATAAIAVPMLRAQSRCDRAEIRRWVWSKASLARAEASHKSLYVHWRDCKYRREMADKNVEGTTCSTQELFDRFNNQTPRVKTALCSECVDDEIASVTRLAKPVKYGVATEVAPGVRVTFLDAGHIPGSASILFEVVINEKTRRVLFSGDLGNGLSPLQPGPKAAPPVDAVFVETTYGAIPRAPSVKQQRAEFRLAVAAAVKQGGVTWIPCFALDRTQKILYELHLAQRDGLLPERLPIYCPSPTAKEVTAVYSEHRRDGWFAPEVAGDALAFAPSEVHTTVPSGKRLPRPCIILSTSDILIAQWMRRLLTGLLPEPSTSIFLVGYQDPEGAGELLKQGATELEIEGAKVSVRAKVSSFQCFSGHGDAADIDAWLANVPQQAAVVLVHGGENELKTRAEQLRAQGRKRVIVAKPSEMVNLQQ